VAAAAAAAAAAGIQAPPTSIAAYFDSIDKAGKLDTPRENVSAAVALGLARAVAAGGLRATNDSSVSMESVAMQLAGLLGDPAGGGSSSTDEASATMAGNAAEAACLQLAAQEGSSAVVCSTLSRTTTTSKSSRVPALRLQQQQTYTPLSSNTQPGSPASGSVATAPQQSCRASLQVLGAASSAMDGIMKFTTQQQNGMPWQHLGVAFNSGKRRHTGNCRHHHKQPWCHGQACSKCSWQLQRGWPAWQGSTAVWGAACNRKS
jgi:hypothetical protein